jgi:hypothetical protein
MQGSQTSSDYKKIGHFGSVLCRYPGIRLYIIVGTDTVLVRLCDALLL